jgi:hypothetical protein
LEDIASGSVDFDDDYLPDSSELLKLMINAGADLYVKVFVPYSTSYHCLRETTIEI